MSISDWIGSDSGGPPTRPELAAVSGVPILCIYGDGEEDSICPELTSSKITRAQVGKGHHFSGEYAQLADRILTFAKTPRAE